MSIKILLIEDNPDHILLTKKILEKGNGQYQVDSTDDAREGLKKILEDKYDLILCDFRMPPLSALDILRELKKENKDSPFIVVTASGSEKAAVDLMREGAYDYVIKDLSYEDTLPIVIKRTIDRYNMKKEKEKMEEVLRKSEERFRKLFEQSNDAILIHNLNGQITEVNNRACEMLGYSRAQLLTMQVSSLHPKECLSDSAKALHNLGENHSARFESLFKKVDGSIINVEISSRVVNIEEGVIQSIVRDITGRKKAQRELEDAYQKLKETQEQLIQSAKMAAMGQLAAGISHELNQPLTGIKGFAQAAFMDLKESDPLRADLSKIIEQADRMDRIIKNVRFFARKSEFKMEELDINQPIEDSLMLLSQQLKVHNIRVAKHFAENLPKIKGDQNQLQQIFLNLITNAKDAIGNLNNPDGGELLIKTSLSEDKKNIEVVFQDTGCGISEENLSNVFNPFFTTKSPGGGIGLGLAIVYRIVENHQGKIEFESQEGKGTTFKITLPVYTEAA